MLIYLYKIQADLGEKKLYLLVKTQIMVAILDAIREDITNEQFTFLTKKIIDKMNLDVANRHKIERETILQANCPYWHEVRKIRVTASNFGKILNVRTRKSYKNIVKNILYSSFGSKYTEYGTRNEPKALQQTMIKENIIILPCGIFIHKKYPCLAASPDGLIGENGIVEVKCPWSAREMTVLEGVEAGKINFLKKNNKSDPSEVPYLYKKHPYYFQVQGQLEIADKDYCLFVVWTPKELKIETIYRDKEFFRNKMLKNLLLFFVNSLFPEIIDSRVSRNMELRDYPEEPLENVYTFFEK